MLQVVAVLETMALQGRASRRVGPRQVHREGNHSCSSGMNSTIDTQTQLRALHNVQQKLEERSGRQSGRGREGVDLRGMEWLPT